MTASPNVQTTGRIPKIIHSCWFGKSPKPALLLSCAESWTRNLPAYSQMEWNEDTFPLMEQPFFRTAYEAKKWAFCSDYARAWAIFTHGGVYLDTDVEVRLPFDSFLDHRAFSGFERDGSPFTAVWGSERHHPWPEAVLQYYEDRVFDPREPPNTATVSRLLVNRFGVDPRRDRLVHGNEGIVIYPSSTFCVDLAACYAVHHFEGSWLSSDLQRRPFKEVVSLRYHLSRAVELGEVFAMEEITTFIGDERILKMAASQVIARMGGWQVIRAIFPLLKPLVLNRIRGALSGRRRE